jgi:tryptophan synthase alpha chain
MNRINKLFSEKKNIMSVYFTAGYPHLESTLTIIDSLYKSGVDMIEIGMPYSDPLADGPVIQNSSSLAIKNGMSINVLFKQLERIREITDMPLILMGYYNPVLQYGIERFCKKCNETGIDGLIIPDLPPDEWQTEYKSVFEKNNLKNIFLVTPETSNERIKYIDSISDAFIYLLSSSSTTGKSFDISKQESYFSRIRSMNLLNPTMIGFGISDKESFNKAVLYSNGAIIGSAYINAIGNNEDISEATKAFVSKIRPTDNNN